MIVGFSTHSSGGGQGPVSYVTGLESPDETTRTPAPVVVRGDPDLVRCLIDALPFERTYASGVLSFAPGEVITPAMEQAIMDGFERVAFAGLEPDRYSILWVRHLHAGHHELHFVTPRVELATGKSLNIHPPGRASRALFDTFRSQVNAAYGLADPDDPDRARDVSIPNHLAKIQAQAQRQGQARKVDIREAITAMVRREVEAGRVKDRQGVARYLTAQGYALTRAGKDYLTVLEAATGARVRLKGGLYSVEGFNARETAARGVAYGVADPARAAALAAQLTLMVEARARFHRQRYGVAQEGEGSQYDLLPPGPPTEPLRDYVTRHLGAEALRPAWAGHRRRGAAEGPSQERGRGSDDRSGAAISRRLAAVGDALSGAGRRYLGALADFDRAGGRLERASRAVSSSAAALDSWLERQWWRMYYGQDRGMER